MPGAHAGAACTGIVVNLPGGFIGRRIGGKDVVISVRAVRGVGLYALEPLVSGAGMIQHKVHVDGDALGMGGVNEALEVLLGAVERVQSGIVVHLVTVITARGMGRRQPQGRHAQTVQVVQLVLNALEVSHAVSVRVGKAVDEHLVGGRGPLGAVKGGRSGDDGYFYLSLFLGLGHGQCLGCCSHFEGNRPRTGLSGIIGGRHRHLSIPASGRRFQANPTGRFRTGPCAGGRYSDRLRLSSVSAEIKRRRRHRHGVFHNRVRIRLFIFAACRQGPRGKHNPEIFFHNPLFLRKKQVFLHYIHKNE